MFETSRPNAAPIAILKAAVGHPIANSLSTDVYRLMPNYTDVNSFSERGWLTLNLAPIGNETRYHSPGDDLAALDSATLQHMGDQTLALAATLANGPPGPSGDRIFMDVAGHGLVTLPLVIGAGLLIGLLVGFLVISVKRGGLARGAAVTVGTIVGSGVLTWLALALIGAVRSGMFWRAHPVWTHLATYASVMLAAAVLLATVGRRLETRQLRPVSWFVYLVIGAVIGLIAPGGIIFFLFPPLLTLIGMLARSWWRPAEAIGSAAGLLFLYLTWGAMLGLLEELLNSGPMWAFAPLGTLLILPVLIEAKPLIDAAQLRGAAIITGSMAFIGWAAVAAAPAYSADRQQMFVIEHVTDVQGGKARWSVRNGHAALPDAYSDRRDWRWAKLPYAESRRWLADAPAAANDKAPGVEPTSSVRNGRQRTISLRLRSYGAERISLVAPEGARIRAAGATGFVRPIDSGAEEGQYSVSCSGRSCDGMTLEIVTDNPSPIGFIVVGAHSGLPPSAQPLIAARPKFARPQYTPDQTVVFTHVKL